MDIDNFSKNYISPFLQQISKENKRLVLMSDFNINLLNFNDVDSVKNFVDILESSFLLPSISLATRVTATSSTLIDNIFFLLQNVKSLPEILLVCLTTYPNILYLNRIHMLAHQNQFNTEIGKSLVKTGLLQILEILIGIIYSLWYYRSRIQHLITFSTVSMP